MPLFQKNQPKRVIKLKNEVRRDYLTEIHRKEKLLSLGIYSLIIIITVALMLIILNLIIRF